VSNPRTFVVGDRPESLEAEPNGNAAQANPLAVNAVVHGRIDPADVDCFAIEGEKGQRLLFDLEAERVDSRLDATLRLFDPSGRELVECRDTLGADPLLDVTLPSAGRYFLKVHDVTYSGSNDHAYRLTLTDGPHLDAVVPAVARASETSMFTLIGRNLGGEPVPGLTIDGRPLERKTVTLTAPSAADPDPDWPTLGYVPSQAAPRRGFEYAVDSPSGRSNPVFIAVGADPVVVEREPNDDGAHAQEVTLPCDVSASFAATGDVDVFRFRAKKGETWVFDASAERLGSPADPTFVVQKVGDKGVTTDLVAGEDTADKGGQSRFFTASADASLRWSAPEDGTYQVAVSDLYGSQRGDVRLSYRLNVRPERPDFHLFVLPEHPEKPDSLSVRAGGRTLAYVLAWRVDGFDGPIRVEAVDLPPGVTFEPVVIPAGQSLAPVVFEASDDARPFLGTARLVGRGRFGDRKGELGGMAAAMLNGPDVSHEALGGSAVWPEVFNPQVPNQQFPAPARLTRGVVLKTVGPAPLTLTARPSRKVAVPGGVVALDLSVSRREGFAEAVAVTLPNPLPGMGNPPAPVSIPKGSDSGVLALTLPRGLAPGVYSLVLQGSGPYPFSKDPNAKTKPNVPLNEPSNPVTLVVRPSPATVEVVAKEKTLKVGGTIDVTVTVTPKDKNAPAGPIAVSLAAPGVLKIASGPVTAEPGKPVTLSIRASADSPPGAAPGLTVRATVPLSGEPVEIDEPLALTIAK
jgi:hypothetical protein